MIAVGEYFEMILAIEFNVLPEQLALDAEARATWLATEDEIMRAKEPQQNRS